MKWRLLPRALRDLRDIEAHVSADSPEAAAAIASRLRKAFDLISSRPDIGRPASRTGVREWSRSGIAVCHSLPPQRRHDRNTARLAHEAKSAAGMVKRLPAHTPYDGSSKPFHID